MKCPLPKGFVPENKAGQRRGRLVVSETYRFNEKKSGLEWLCHCDCGNEIYLSVWKVDDKVSCGCHKTPHRHDKYRWKLMSVLAGMKDRCNNPRSHAFHYYGGRGITVCKEWMFDTKTFYDWAIKKGYKPGLQIDRIDNYKGYERSNCRFVTASENLRNTRRMQDKREGRVYRPSKRRDLNKIFDLPPTEASAQSPIPIARQA